jgi:hypothetical protein
MLQELPNDEAPQNSEIEACGRRLTFLSGTRRSGHFVDDGASAIRDSAVIASPYAT